MYVTKYRIHLMTGQVIHVAEGRTSKEAEKDLVDRFKEALPEGVLEIAHGSFPNAFIPVTNILYISRVSEEFIP